MGKTYNTTIRVIDKENEVFELPLLSNFRANVDYHGLTDDDFRDVLNAMFPDMDCYFKLVDLVADFFNVWDYDVISIMNFFNIRDVKRVDAKVKNDEEINARVETASQTYGMCFRFDSVHCVVPDSDLITKLSLHDANNETFEIEVSADYPLNKNTVDVETADLEINDLLGYNIEYSKLTEVLTEYYTTDDYSIYLILNALKLKDITKSDCTFKDDVIKTKIKTPTGIYLVKFARTYVFSQICRF